MSELDFETLAQTPVKWFGAKNPAVAKLDAHRNRMSMFEKWPSFGPMRTGFLVSAVARMLLRGTPFDAQPLVRLSSDTQPLSASEGEDAEEKPGVPEGFSVKVRDGIASIRFNDLRQFEAWLGPETAEQAHTGTVEGWKRWVMVGNGGIHLAARAFEATDHTPRPYQHPSECGLHVALFVAPLRQDLAVMMPE